MRTPILDETAGLLAHGYAWLTGLRHESPGGVARTRVLGRRAVGICGPDATRFFYDEDHVRRHAAIPRPVRSTLSGHHAVHTLDHEEHRQRKSYFLSVLGQDAVADLVARFTEEWDDAVRSWRPGVDVVLHDEASRVLTRAVCRWAGVPLDAGAVDAVTRDLTSLSDGFATPGPRHWRARRARNRREAWLAGLVEDVRAGTATAPAGSAVDEVVRHRDADGSLLEPRVAAVELLNVLRPTVAVAWFAMFAGHALHLWPDVAERLRSGDPAYPAAFAHEVRRFYPFAPFLGGRAVRDLTWRDEPIPAGSLVLLDLWGQNHDAELWGDPHTFRPERFLGRPIGAHDLVPQGGGDPRTGHRCPGEPATVGLLETLAVRLARTEYRVPEQDLTISLRRVPALVRSRFVITPAG